MMPLAADIDDISAILGASLEDHLSSVVYSAGSVIFSEGESEGFAFLIESGLVEISRTVNSQKDVLCVLGPGELFGEMAALDHQPRSATATALSEVEVLPVSATHLQNLLDQAHPLVNMLVRILLDRFRGTVDSLQSEELDRNLVTVELKIDTNAVLKEARRRALERIHLEKALQEALRRREFDLHFQPVVSFGDGRIVGFEALIRWFSPENGLVSPVDFIEVAEESGLIVPIGLWVVEHAFHHLSRFQKRFENLFPERPPLFMSANVSGRQVEDVSAVESIGNVIQKIGVDPKSVKLEITEGVLMSNPEIARVGLQKLKNLGFKLAIDDFGTGYSSLSYIQKFNLDTLKIDRSFVCRMLEDEGSNKLVEAIIGLAHGLGMDLIAEGVERPEEMTRLKELGCELGQGYLFSRPVPADQIMEILEKPNLL